MSTDAIGRFGVINRMAVQMESILKCLYKTCLSKLFKFSISLWDPSGLGLRNIGEINSSFSCKDFAMTPLLNNFCISCAITVFSDLENCFSL